MPRPVVIDGLNLAYWSASPPSLRVPVSVAAALVERGYSVLMFFDASAPHRFAHEADAWAQLLHLPALVCVVRSGIPADRVLLRHARLQGACILSRDHFRDHRRRFRSLVDDPARRLQGHVADGRVIVSALMLDHPLPISATAAVAALASAAARREAGLNPSANDPCS